jgi:poly-gamma-glutamate synthesis protein (capsule biosynthesis protein)
MASGDVFPDLEDGASSFQHLSPLFARADIVFGNCEGVYSDRGSQSQAPTHMVFGGAPRRRGEMLGSAPFHVMTLANNHAVDGGYVGLADTMQMLHDQGVATTGAGQDLDEATRPALLERSGKTVAFLGFASSFPIGYEARASRPGIAPLRIDTFYRNPLPNFNDPGIDPEVVTVPRAEDLRLLHESIARAKEKSDYVVIGFHQGTNAEVRNATVPKAKTHDKIWKDVVQESELATARDAVDHGADAVICAQHAALRGMEIYKGKPIFYGMGALVHHFHRRGGHTRSDHKLITEWESDVFPYWPYDRPETRMSGVAMLWFDGDTIAAGFVPAMMLPDGSTEPLADNDPRADAVAKHLNSMNADEGFGTRLVDDKFGEWRLLRVEAD